MAGSDTKEKLVLAAIDLFSTKGFAGTSVDEIAAAAGVKGPSVYKHFKSKEALLDAIIDRADTEYNKGMGLMADKLRFSSGRELKEFSMHQIAFTLDNEEIRKMRRLLNIEQYRNEVLSERATHHQIANLTKFYTGIFKKMMADGVMVEGDPEILALQYTGAVSILIQLCDRSPEKIPEVMNRIERLLEQFVKTFCN